MKTTLIFIFLVAVVSWIEGKRCPRTNSKPYRYCTDVCSSAKDCKQNEKCLCDGDCGRSCVKNGLKCGPPPKPKNSRNPETTRGSSFNSTVSYKCKANHKLRGSKTRVCRAIGQWDGKKARCRLFCPPLKDMRYGNSRPDTKGIKVTFWCWQGYKLEGQRVLTCQSNAKWDHPQPKCSPPTCGPVQVPDNAEIGYPKRIPKVYNLGSRVQFTCKAGYFRQGIALQQCNPGGWTTNRFSCIPKTCGDPGTPTNGKKEGYQYTFKSRVKYQCNVGYRLSGSAYRNCQANQIWSGSTPKCRAVDCGSLRAPVHGEILDETKTTYQGRTTFRCTTKGYEMKGSRQRTCQANGQWDGEETKCEIIKCDVPENPKNGRHFVSKGYFYGGSVRFECDTNYTLSSSAAIYCQENKKWSGKSPYCSAPCRDPGVPKNVRRLHHDFRHNKKVAFRCVGQYYVMKGASEITCTDGRWDRDSPKCYSPCPPPYRPANGQRYGSDFRHEKRVTFRCNYGYQIIGASSATCNDGKWNSNPPVCKGICRDPGNPQSGLIVSSKRQYLEGDSVEFRCWNGFDLFGKNKTYCRNRNWDAVRPNCRGRCRDPGALQNGFVEQEKFRIGSEFRHGGGEIQYKCRAGYTMVGDATIRCSDGRWSSSVPRCKVPCLQLDAPKNGRVRGNDFTHGKRVVFECARGYKLVGALSVTCQNGIWSDNTPACKASCPKPDDPPHGWKRDNDFSHGEIVRFRCNAGYQIFGTQLTCNDGTWEGQPPLCKGVCPNLGRLQDGFHIPDKAKYVNGDNVGFRCRQGFDLFGSRKIHCQDREWSASKPACKERCSYPGVLQNGFVEQEKFKIRNKFRHGDGEIKYKCDANYTMVGDATLQCSDGSWSSVVPQCKASCDRPPAITRGWMEGNDFGHRKSVTFSCEEGYSLAGPGKLTCEDGKWDPNKPPVCKVLCSKPDAPKNGRVTGNDFTHGGKVDFECARGYKLVGASSVTCRNGNWSDNTPECRGFCQDPGTPQNGLRLPNLGTYFEGEKVRFRCNSNFDLLGTKEDLYCRDGKWNGSLPNCRKRCSSPGSLTRGLTMVNKVLQLGRVFRNGQIIQYVCEDQYVMVGNADLVCDDGNWSSDVPQCKASCGEPGDIVNGSKDGNNFRHGHSVVYSCFGDYVLQGQKRLTCNDGTWNSTPPTCSKVPPFQCNFDDSNCGFTQSKNDDFDWTRQSGSTLSASTGPSRDVSGSGYYMYIEASLWTRFGKKARIEKSGLTLSRDQCLSFYYHMYGRNVGALKVFVGKTEVFAAHGNKGNKWHQANVKIAAASDNVAFEATIGQNRFYWYLSDIAIDDISVNDCST